MLFNKGLILSIGLLALASCSNDVEDTSAPGNIQGEGRLQTTKNSSFVAEPTVQQADISYSSEYGHQWSDIPTHALIGFKTCLKDIAKALPIIDQRFAIQTPFGTKKRYTQTNGCLTWTEHINFNILEKERLIDYPVTIKGLGRYPGEYKLNLAVNPWPDATKRHVLDLEHTSSEHAVNPLNQSFIHTVEQSNLDISQIDFAFIKREVDQERKVETLTYDLELGLNYIYTNIQGSQNTKELTRGLFDIEVALIEKDRDQDSVFLITRTQIQASIEQGKINKRVVLEIPKNHYPKNHSPIELYVRLSPKMGPKGLKPRQGLLDMNGLTELKSDVLRDLTNDKNADETFSSLASYATPRGLSNKDDFTSNEENFGVKVGKVTLGWGSLVGNGDHRSHQRTLRANFSTCLTDPLSQDDSRPITDAHVSIRVFPEVEDRSELDKNQKVAKLGSKGCLSSHFHISYNLYEAPRWIPIAVELTGLSGDIRGVVKKRVVEINPWNKNDFGYDTEHEQTPKMSGTQAPRIIFQSIGYGSEGKAFESFRINKFMQMSFAKSYEIQLEPKLELGHAYDGKQTAEAITFGDYSLKTYLFTPKEADIDYQNIDLDDFQFLSAAQKDVSVSSQGRIHDSIDLPFYFTEAYHFPYKNLLLVQIESKTHSLKSGVFAVPFYEGRKAQLSAVEVSSEQLEKLETKTIQEIAQTGVKDVDNILSSKEREKSSLEYFQQKFKADRKQAWKSEGEVILGTREELNQRQSIGGDQELTKDQLLSPEDFRVLTTESGDMPNVILKKLCRHFFPAPQKRTLGGFGPSGESTVGGELYKNCLKNPREFINTQALNHVQQILSKGRELTQDGGLNKYGKAVLVEQERGNISLGMGFYAADGLRSWEAEGTQDVTSIHGGVDLFLHAPPPLLMAFNAGVSQAHEMVSQKVQSDMQVVFDRNYRQLGKPDLEYNKIELEMTANIRRCFSATNSKGVKRALHICEKDDRLTKLREQWFFIAEKNPQSLSTITDPLRPGDTTHTQLIRGQQQFNQLWDKYKSEDVAVLIKSIPGKKIRRPLVHYKTAEHDGGFFRAYIDQNFPGIVTPYQYRQ